MTDTHNYNYYDPNPGPAPRKLAVGRRSVQLAGLVIFAVIVVVLVVLLAMNIVKNRQLALDEDLRTQADELRIQLSAECPANDAGCLGLARADAARRLGYAKACEGLFAKELTDCVSLIAIDQQDPEVCELLSGADKTSCKNVPTLLTAQATLNLKLCDEITVSELRASCIIQVEDAVIAAGTCVQSGLDESLCGAYAALQSAIATEDPAACTALGADVAEDCLWSQNRLDADNDGLFLEDERRLGTSSALSDTDADGVGDGDEVGLYLSNPLNPDTDNDGYSDGIEIDGGFDPLK